MGTGELKGAALGETRHYLQHNKINLAKYSKTMDKSYIEHPLF